MHMDVRAHEVRAVGSASGLGAWVCACLALALGIWFGAFTGTAAASGLDARLDAALARGARQAGTPGATAAIVKDGKVVWAGAYGRARGGHGSRMTPGSLIPIASTTKTVTATMAMALAQRGQVVLNRPIHHELPRLPASRRVTPRMLMNHSSGLNDYFDDGIVGRIYRRHPFHHWTRGQVLAHVHRLRFPPGSRHSYSNTNYVALGGVLTHDSHRSIERLFRQYVGTPLGLRHSTFRYGTAPQRKFAHPLRVRGRGRLGDKFGAHGRVPTDYWGEVWTDGGLATTPSDLARIGNALYAGDLLSAASVKAMLPPRPHGWGLGTFDRFALGTRWIGHDGWYGGFQTENWTDRKRGVTIDVFTNRAGQRTVAAPLWHTVAAAYRP
jgi:D-alanyl-D-alanine carboxypeptidase